MDEDKQEELKRNPVGCQECLDSERMKGDCTFNGHTCSELTREEWLDRHGQFFEDMGEVESYVGRNGRIKEYHCPNFNIKIPTQDDLDKCYHGSFCENMWGCHTFRHIYGSRIHARHCQDSSGCPDGKMLLQGDGTWACNLCHRREGDNGEEVLMDEDKLKDKLIDEVLEKMCNDIKSDGKEEIGELLIFIPTKHLVAYLPEENWNAFKALVERENKYKGLPGWIVNGVCEKLEEAVCNLGYACDGCPYNPDYQQKE